MTFWWPFNHLVNDFVFRCKQIRNSQISIRSFHWKTENNRWIVCVFTFESGNLPDEYFIQIIRIDLTRLSLIHTAFTDQTPSQLNRIIANDCQTHNGKRARKTDLLHAALLANRQCAIAPLALHTSNMNIQPLIHSLIRKTITINRLLNNYLVIYSPFLLLAIRMAWNLFSLSIPTITKIW